MVWLAGMQNTLKVLSAEAKLGIFQYNKKTTIIKEDYF